VRLLAIGQRDSGHTVCVGAIVGTNHRKHPFPMSLEQAGIDAETLAIHDRAYLRERAFVADLCRTFHPSVVHTHGFRPDVVDAGVARRLGVPTITTVHGFTGGGWKVPIYERIQLRAFRRFDAVVAVSRPLGERLADRGVRRERIHVVPNAYTPAVAMLDRATARRRLSLPEDRFVIGWVGRLSREKGADVLLDAMPRLTSLGAVVSFLGDGAERTALGSRAAALGVTDRITWHGVVPDGASFFRAFDVLVVSSRTEGCPMVLFEAMAAGVPIVASRVGGVPDVLSSTEALLVGSNDPVALAEAISAVHRDRETATARAAAAHDRLQAEFRLAPWLTRYEALYRRIQKVSPPEWV
jgi:glycosyltransferase involved in cell wall biosynthesis